MVLNFDYQNYKYDYNTVYVNDENFRSDLLLN